MPQPGSFSLSWEGYKFYFFQRGGCGNLNFAFLVPFSELSSRVRSALKRVSRPCIFPFPKTFLLALVLSCRERTNGSQFFSLETSPLPLTLSLSSSEESYGCVLYLEALVREALVIAMRS